MASARAKDLWSCGGAAGVSGWLLLQTMTPAPTYPTTTIYSISLLEKSNIKSTPPLMASHEGPTTHDSRTTSHESRLHGVHATNCHSTVGGRPQCPPRTPRPQYRFSVKNSIQNKTVCVSYSVTTRTPWAGNLSQSLAIYGFVMYGVTRL